MKLFSLVSRGDIHSQKKIIPSDAWKTVLEAHQIIDQAKEDAKQLQEESIQKGLEEQKKGFEEGFNRGLAEWTEKMLHLEQEFQASIQHLEKQIFPIIIKAAQKIVVKQLTLNPEAIVDIVFETLRSVVQSRRIIIYVSKQDRALIEAKETELRKMLPHLDFFAIAEKEELEQGDCLIKTDSGLVNATLQKKWGALEKALEKYLQKSHS